MHGVESDSPGQASPFFTSSRRAALCPVIPIKKGGCERLPAQALFLLKYQLHSIKPTAFRLRNTLLAVADDDGVPVICEDASHAQLVIIS
jgi:hypothetical protein